MPKKLYTTGKVAKTFGFSYAAVKKWAYAGKMGSMEREAIKSN